MSYGIIYKATGPTGKVYIGQTVKTLAERKRGHKYQALKDDRRSIFQVAILEHGFHTFAWEQIDQADTPEELDRKEKKWIARYKSTDPEKGYNGTDGGIDGHPNEEIRRRMSQAKSGEKHHFFGKHLSAEHRRKIGEAGKGHPPYRGSTGISPSQETRRKISEARKGIQFSAEHRRKLSEAKKGKPSPVKGKRFSAERCKNMSEARQGSKSPFAKLNESKVREILLGIKRGERQKDLAKEFNVAYETIQGIVHKRRWAHVSV
jgi:group I intron endonuclease